MNKFIESELGPLLDTIIDYRGKTPKKLKGEWTSSGIPALSAKNIKHGKIVNHESIRYVNDDLYYRWMKEEVKKGDILMTSEAPLGETFYIKNNDKILLSQRLFAIRTDGNKLDSGFLFYYLNSRIGNYELLSRATGTTVGGIRQTALAKVRVRYPESVIEQKQIASVLSAYDNLIENNEKRIKALKEMAQLLYTEWFVKFKFPGHEKVKMIDSGTEYGQIPQEWEVKSFYDVVDNLDSKRKPVSSMKRQQMQGCYPYYGAAKIIDYVNDYIFDGKYLLIAEDGSVITSNGKPMLQFVNEKFWVSNHAHIVKGKLLSTEILYLRLRRFNIKPLITGSAQPKITKDNLSRVLFIIPEHKIKDIFTNIVSGYFDEIFNLQNRNKSLSQTCGLLIPQLVSGKRELK